MTFTANYSKNLNGIYKYLNVHLGLFPGVHGLVGDYVFNSARQQLFRNFTSESDFDLSWWPYEPIFVTTQKVGISTAVFYLPECEVSCRCCCCCCLCMFFSTLFYKFNKKKQIKKEIIST